MPEAQNLLVGDDKADSGDPLWAGLPSVTLARFASDPCDNGRTELGDTPVVYDDWVRQRASDRNLCFEVWKPGVTDWDNPDFWKQLDVRVHYRHGSAGPWQSAYVNSIDRRGNNRRYAWALDITLDPMFLTASIATMTAPFRIVSETAEWAFVESDLEVYFTVNGRALNTATQRPFVVTYQGYLRKGALAASPNGYVLHDLVSCEQGAARFGSGAGLFAADIRDPAGLAELGAGLDGAWIYGANVGLAAPALMSMTYSEQYVVSGETLPAFRSHSGLRVIPDGSTMTVELDIHDRALGANRTVRHVFTGCTAS